MSRIMANTAECSRDGGLYRPSEKCMLYMLNGGMCIISLIRYTQREIVCNTWKFPDSRPFLFTVFLRHVDP